MIQLAPLSSGTWEGTEKELTKAIDQGNCRFLSVFPSLCLSDPSRIEHARKSLRSGVMLRLW